MRILGVSEHMLLAQSFYRYGLPFKYLENQGHITFSHEKTNLNWFTLSSYDCVLFFTPRTELDLQAIHTCKGFNKAVWVDVDDYMEDISVDNPSYHFFGEKELEIFHEAIKEATVVTTSTEFLRDKYLKLNPNVIYVPNAFPLDLVPYQPVRAINKNVTWRGSAHHKRDLQYYKDDFIFLANKYPDYCFKFVGSMPEPFYDVFNKNTKLFNFDHEGWVGDVLESIDKLQRLSSKVHVVPLFPCEFNYAKSQIAWIEATLAGSVCVMPDWQEWKGVGCRYGNFADAVVNAIESEHSDEAWQMSWNLIQSNYDLSIVNELRIEIIKNL